MKKIFLHQKQKRLEEVLVKGKSDVKDLFDLSIDEDYYKPIIKNVAFHNIYIQYESKGNKDT